jgi:hypothetical protein
MELSATTVGSKKASDGDAFSNGQGGSDRDDKKIARIYWYAKNSSLICARAINVNTRLRRARHVF